MPSVQVPFHITSGIPFAKTIVATLPNGRTWWTDVTQFEVLAQIRKADTVDSDIIVDLKQFISVDFDFGTDPDEVTVELVMTGTDTRLVTDSGHYDVVMSDTFAVDGRAIVLIKGPVHRYSLVSGPVEETV